MIELKTEVVVIGSGFGGAVAASRLVEQGIAVIMLERGPWRNTVPVNSMNVREHAELPRKSFGHLVRNGVMAVCHYRWSRKRGTGINRRRGTYEVHFHKGFTSVASSQVGGGSLIWGGLVDRPRDTGFWDHVAEGVSEAILAPHFERVSAELGVSLASGHEIDFPGSLLDTLRNDSRFDLSANDDVAAAHRLTECSESGLLPFGIERKTSRRREHLSFGCLDGSKASTDAIYLGPALAKGLQLLAQCEVESVQRQNEGGYCVFASHVRHKQRIKVHCNQLVIGAGTYNTVRLLLEAQQRNQLKPMPGLGKGIGVNGDEISILLGMVKSDREDDRNGLFTSFSLANGDKRLLHGLINPDFPWLGSKLMRSLLGPLLRSSLLVCMGEDVASGSAVLKKGRLHINYHPRNHNANRTAAEENKTIASFLKTKSIAFRKTLTAHLFGGARVAQQSTEGVVNGLGECHQNAGLYIVDAAAIPKAPGTPPSLNIAAWASHVAETVIRNSDTRLRTQIRGNFEKIIEQSKASELALLFSTLPTAKAMQANAPVGNWKVKTLVADRRWFSHHFDRLFREALSLKLSAKVAFLERLQPQTAALDCAVLANSWDGSGLVYQVATAVNGEQINLQLRKIPDREVWLARSASEREFLGWHLLIQ